jgi:hypothetical protein
MAFEDSPKTTTKKIITPMTPRTPMTLKNNALKFDDGKLPYFTVLTTQFPLAVKEVVRRSLEGHIKYEKPGEWDNWFKVAEERGVLAYNNALMRHLFQDGEDTELQHDAAVAWNALAKLEYKLRKDMYPELNKEK